VAKNAVMLAYFLAARLIIDLLSSSSYNTPVAIAVDTSHALQRLHGTPPIVLATTSESSKQLVAPWMDTVVSLGKKKAHHGQQQQPRLLTENDVVLESSWNADIVRRGLENQHSVVEYSMVQRPETGLQIQWKRLRIKPPTK
jgi:hypothetical protein